MEMSVKKKKNHLSDIALNVDGAGCTPISYVSIQKLRFGRAKKCENSWKCHVPYSRISRNNPGLDEKVCKYFFHMDLYSRCILRNSKHMHTEIAIGLFLAMHARCA
jgi:hypothetical protein